MTDGAPQGSPLSPVLWLIHLARMLKLAEIRFPAPPLLNFTHDHDNRHKQPCAGPRTQVFLVSHVDDVNPLIITTGSKNQNKEVTQRVIKALEDTASEH